jgi:hypothetical protein
LASSWNWLAVAVRYIYLEYYSCLAMLGFIGIVVEPIGGRGPLHLFGIL